jgi:SpoVK/Ycf46/Vps4 family AAA+-type ATPase
MPAKLDGDAMATPMKLPESLTPVRIHVEAQYPILYLLSWEEARVVSHLVMLAAALDPVRLVYTWSRTEGCPEDPEDPGAYKDDPVGMMDFAISSTEPAIFIMKDLHPFIRERADVVRRLRDVYQALRGARKTLVILAPLLVIPAENEKEIIVLDYPLPDVQETGEIMAETVDAIKPGALARLPERKGEELMRAFIGLTADEIALVANKIFLRRGKIDETAQEDVIEEKRMILRKSEILEYFPSDIRMRHVGGLKNLKRWAQIRLKGFSDEARKFGLPMPRGVLITGISGCGKSLCIQALAHMWALPLLRLDMGRVFSGFAGTPEESLRRAILTVEALAPAILWIDEIEMGVSVFSDSVESGATSRIFAMFLTWMQEKKAPVFIAATSNDIDRLPPEMIRKGRFDEIFFVDLPRIEERIEIIKIHLEKRGKRASEVSIEGLAKAADGFTGAEIEQAVVTAMYEAFNLNRELEIGDIYRSLGNMVPLSVTMKEQITKTKRWADNRAVRAS